MLDTVRYPEIKILDDDIVEICGIKYSMELFRSLSFCPIGSVLKVVDRRDGVVTVVLQDVAA